jgi:HlyD family secretion protein
MKLSSNTRRTFLITAILISIAGLFLFTMLHSGPLAPVAVTLADVKNQELSPALFGIGTVEARYRFKIGPTHTGRLVSTNVDVGDMVQKGQPLATMDPVDLAALIVSQQSKINALDAQISMAQSQVAEATAQEAYAASQAERTGKLIKTRAISQEADNEATRNRLTATATLKSAQSAVIAATADLAAAHADLDALILQKKELTLLAPVDGLIVSRRVEPGSTVVAGDAVLEMIQPNSLWIQLRLNQLESAGLTAGLPARITLRSQPGLAFAGHVLRVEPLADAVTEELLAKVVFETLPTPLPPLGELVEVNLHLPAEPITPVVPAAAIQLQNGSTGVWLFAGKKPRFVVVHTGRRSAEGLIQILDGLKADGSRVIVHSANPISTHSRIRITQSIAP